MRFLFLFEGRLAAGADGGLEVDGAAGEGMKGGLCGGVKGISAAGGSPPLLPSVMADKSLSVIVGSHTTEEELLGGGADFCCSTAGQGLFGAADCC